MSEGALGKVYQDGEIIVRQGDSGDSMFVVQAGQVQVVAERGGEETLLRVAQAGELLGEMAIFEQQPRSATLRALGETKILTIDKKNFMRRINEDPTIAFRILETMSQRVRALTDEVVRLKAEISEA
jgi:CRP/FNR family cyclic AMP-dependent transcriptional regulator